MGILLANRTRCLSGSYHRKGLIVASTPTHADEGPCSPASVELAVPVRYKGDGVGYVMSWRGQCAAAFITARLQLWAPRDGEILAPMGRVSRIQCPCPEGMEWKKYHERSLGRWGCTMYARSTYNPLRIVYFGERSQVSVRGSIRLIPSAPLRSVRACRLEALGSYLPFVWPSRCMTVSAGNGAVGLEGTKNGRVGGYPAFSSHPSVYLFGKLNTHRLVNNWLPGSGSTAPRADVGTTTSLVALHSARQAFRTTVFHMLRWKTLGTAPGSRRL